MKTLFLSLLLLCGLSAGCIPSVQGPAIDARALARGTVTALAEAWTVSVDVCLAVEKTPHQCAKILLPAHDALIAAASAVDTWDAAAKKNLPCLIFSIVQDINVAESLAADAGVHVPQAVDDALKLAAIFTPQCASR